MMDDPRPTGPRISARAMRNGPHGRPIGFSWPLPGRRTAFTLVELLTVIFIISLLIGILIPSINAARTQARNASTRKTLDAIKTGLEMFKNENESDFRLTNGYPPSFVHPPIPGYDAFNTTAWEGMFPFLPDAQQPVKVYGAHWLPAMLMGVDQFGYVRRGSVPRTLDNLHQEPWRWYGTNDAGVPWVPPDQRQPLYLDPGNTPTMPTKNLLGRPNLSLFPNWDTGEAGKKMQDLPVIVDAFGQPILYYVSNTHGRTTNMVGDRRNQQNEYTGGVQQRGIPFYFHQDNEGFTGNDSQTGWDFHGRQRPHLIARSGADLSATQFIPGPERPIPEENHETFARYIIDRSIYHSIAADEDPPDDPPLRPVNADSYLLISAGNDGLYGTTADITNLPPWPQN